MKGELKMSREMRELLAQLTKTKEDAKNLVSREGVTKEEIEAKTAEIATINAKIAVLEAVEEEKSPEGGTPLDIGNTNKSMNSIEIVAAFLRGDRSSEEIVNLTSSDTENGVSLIIPIDIQTQITELRRQYKSMKELIGRYPTKTLSGKYPVEDISTLTELIDFDDDGTDINSETGPKFTAVEYTIKHKGGLLPVSNILKSVEAGNLIPYISRWFNKKAIRTENKDIFTKLKAGKTPKPVTSLDGFKEAINKDLDPIFADGIVVTNQDGFNWLDTLKDTDGKYVLQPDPTDKTKKVLFGRFSVNTFSNTELPSATGGVAPFFIGDLKEAADFVELTKGIMLASSEHAGFTKNQTLMRVIEGYDITLKDSGAYLYLTVDIDGI